MSKEQKSVSTHTHTQKNKNKYINKSMQWSILLYLVEVSLNFEDWQHIVYWQKFQLERVDNSGPGAKLRVSLSSATTHPYLCFT